MSGYFQSRRRPARLRSSELFGLAGVFALLAALLYAAVLAAPAGAQRRAGPTRRALAARLLKLDPGRGLGGDTIVGVSNGDLLLGVPNRVNFMLALGSGEKIVGGNKVDELGALGKNATIKGGAGNDLITDTKGSATINTGGGRNEVEVAGHTGRDRVLCAPGSVDRVLANRGDYIAPSCRKAAGSQVVYHGPAPAAADSAQAARNANGCTDNPNVDCAFEAASGSLEGLWWSQKTPPRDCPPSHPYLQNHEFYGFGTSVVRGVFMPGFPEIDFVLFPVRVNTDRYAIGVGVGEVTNWTIFRRDWHMWLHCTSDKSRGYRCSGGGIC